MFKSYSYLIMLAIICLLCIQMAAFSEGQTDVFPIRNISNRLELFLDNWLIDSSDNIDLKLHEPVRKETIFTFDAPWEGSQSGYITILKDKDEYRMYYRAGGDTSQEFFAVALSDDGIYWKRPSVGLFEFNGSKENNIIWTSGKEKGYWECHNFTPFKDTNPNAKPDQLYKGVTLGRRDVNGDGENEIVLLGFASPDGIHWNRIRDKAIITEGSFDSQNTAFWDSNLENYVCYSRIGINGIRRIQRSISKDFLNWSKPELLKYGDSPVEQFYTNAILPYFRAPHIYIGFPMRFVPYRKTIGADKRKVDALSDAVFMSSRDGLNWNRDFMEAYIRPGSNPQNWGNGHGNQMVAWGIIPNSSEEISIYWNENFNYDKTPGTPPTLRRGTIRTDGFVSVNAPYKGGYFITRPLIFKGSNLFINFSTSAVGYIKVEIQDITGTPITGFNLDSCEEIYGDEIERMVKWNNISNLKYLNGKAIKLKFQMKDTDLYSIQFK